MAILDHLISAGVPTRTAAVHVGGTGDTTYTAAGNSQTTATLVNGGTIIVSVCSSSGKGIQLPLVSPCSECFVWNGGGATLYVYGQTGEAIGSGSANAFFAIGTKKSAALRKVSSTQWAQNLSA
jgi:hypothetical protein